MEGAGLWEGVGHKVPSAQQEGLSPVPQQLCPTAQCGFALPPSREPQPCWEAPPGAGKAENGSAPSRRVPAGVGCGLKAGSVLRG